jgi:hypothetical protein
MFQQIRKYIRFTQEKQSNMNSMVTNSKLLERVINDIIQTEGPIHKDLLESRILRYFNTNKRSPRVVKTLQKIPVSDFYGRIDENIVRITPDPKDDPRKITQVHPNEIKNVFHLILQEVRTISKDNLMKMVTNIFGRRSLTKDVKEHLEPMVGKLLESNNYIIENNIIRLVK